MRKKIDFDKSQAKLDVFYAKHNFLRKKKFNK